MSENRVTVTKASLAELKKKKRKIVALTAYDHPTALFIDSSGVDIVLVGDSVGNVMLGRENTLSVTMEEMLHHARAVRLGVKSAMLVCDMPFMSYQAGAKEALINASRFVKEAGANAVKLEGDGYIDAIDAIVRAGIPVMGHLGFTPQSVNQIGGYRRVGVSADEAKKMVSAAKALERAGIFALVLEMVPAKLAKKITAALKVPVIGIGSGPFTDGQILVTHDLVGLYPGRAPSFVRQYADLKKPFKEAVATFVWDVHSGKFPGGK